jgi:hypothetical protein
MCVDAEVKNKVEGKVDKLQHIEKRSDEVRDSTGPL